LQQHQQQLKRELHSALHAPEDACPSKASTRIHVDSGVALPVVVPELEVTLGADELPVETSRCTSTCRSYEPDASSEPKRGWLQATCHTGPSCLQRDGERSSVGRGQRGSTYESGRRAGNHKAQANDAREDLGRDGRLVPGRAT